jgi:hypothetical protein
MPRLGRRRSKYVNLDNLGPKIAEGLTQGASAKEALDEHAVVGKVDGATLVEHMAGDQQYIDRIPVFRAVLRDDTHSVWTDETGRLQRNVVASVDVETFRALQAGHICLRCYEPHPEAFPEQCDLCGYPMRERQILDVAMEFRGMDHVGPGVPIADYLAEQDERMERVEHEIRKQEGDSPQTAVSRRILSPGVKRLRGLTGSVKVDDALIEKATKPEKPDAA